MALRDSVRILCDRLRSSSLYRARAVKYQRLWSRRERGTRPRWSPAGEQLCVDRGVEIALLHWDNGSIAYRLGSKLHTNTSWMHDGNKLILAAFNTIDLWDARGRIVRRWLEPQVRSVAVSADDRLLAIADPSKITLLDFDDTGVRVSFENCYAAEDLALSPDGRYLAGSGDFGLGLWAIDRLAERWIEHGPAVGKAWCEHPVFSPDGSRIAARARGQAGAVLIDLNRVERVALEAEGKDERLPTFLVAGESHVRDVAWLSNEVLAIASAEGVQAWRCARGSQPERLGPLLRCDATEISSNTRKGLLAACDGSKVRVWRWSGLERCASAPGGWSGMSTISLIRALLVGGAGSLLRDDSIRCRGREVVPGKLHVLRSM